VLLSSGTAVDRIESSAIPGKMILQFNEANKQDVELKKLEIEFEYAALKPLKCLSSDLGIWLISYEAENTSDRILLDQLRRNSSLANAQFEHRISLRETIPDDTEFDNQWSLRNIGQTGGLEDADIDASDAWDISVNNGTNILGDTIVMAIIDDGFSMIHDDLNYWKNRQEIPNNGVDDDNNGYLDDYDGWNAYYSSGYIQPKDHGQHVAGIAGARGNNALGICGVNWNGRIMTVAGSSQEESTVVEALGYVYKMRSLYDETNGQKGACVVVTNCSFGVDFGNPDDFPVWEAMYDSLGSLGILNVAATMNGPWNVDEVGDVPTTFATDHLIGVTNTTADDEKNLGAAWGVNSIDLGAPGKGIISTRIPNNYGYKTGTSMAAPHVTGSIGLMFSAADEAFIEKYREEPEMMALFLKDLVLDGVDDLPGFDTLCVSGGRLNVNNTIRKLVNPRIGFSSDTLKMNLAPDSLAKDSITITNLLGFELLYETDVSGIPSWLSLNTPLGTLPGNGTEDLVFHFDANSLGFGVYSYELVLTDIAGMQVSLIIQLDISDPQSVRDHEPTDKVLFCYPNPFSSELNLAVQLESPADIWIRVFSLNSKEIISWEERIHSSKQLLSWNGTDQSGQTIAPGVYILHISGEGINESIRIVKR